MSGLKRNKYGKKVHDFDEGLACWMRRAGLPADVIGQSLGVPAASVVKATAGQQPFDMLAIQAFEKTIFGKYNYCERNLRVANGRRALKAFRNRREAEKAAA